MLSRSCQGPLFKSLYRKLSGYLQEFPTPAMHFLSSSGSCHWKWLICTAAQVQNNDSDSSNRHCGVHLHFFHRNKSQRLAPALHAFQLWKFVHIYIFYRRSFAWNMLFLMQDNLSCKSSPLQGGTNSIYSPFYFLKLNVFQIQSRLHGLTSAKESLIQHEMYLSFERLRVHKVTDWAVFIRAGSDFNTSISFFQFYN